MKNSKIVFSLLAFVGLLLFTACQKENLLSSTSVDPKVPAVQALVSGSGMAPSNYICRTGTRPTCSSRFMLCRFEIQPDPTNAPVDNGASGQAYVDEAQDLIFVLDQVSLDEETQIDLLTNQSFVVEETTLLPQEGVIEAYEHAGYPVPDHTFAFEQGEYPVEMEGEAELGLAPRKIIIKFRRDGSIRTIIVKY